jgi:hypothetical protein
VSASTVRCSNASSQTCRQAASTLSTFPSGRALAVDGASSSVEERAGTCIDSRCVFVHVIGARWPLTAGLSGPWSSWERDSRPSVGECSLGCAPLAVVEQTNVQPAESPRCPSDGSAPRCALLGSRDRALLRRWLRGSFRMESGSKQLGRALRRASFARLSTGAARVRVFGPRHPRTSR